MSITSVGSSFGYIDPRSVAGPSASPPDQSPADDSQPVTPPKPANDTQAQAAPSPTPATAKFAVATGAALIGVQEQASRK